MSQQIRPDEISALIEQRIRGFDAEAHTEDIGTVIEVGDGIARV